MIPGSQEVDVVDAAGVDRAAEDVAEQQHERSPAGRTRRRCSVGRRRILRSWRAAITRLSASVSASVSRARALVAVGSIAVMRPLLRMARGSVRSRRDARSASGTRRRGSAAAARSAAIASPRASSRRTASAEAARVGDREADLAGAGVDERLARRRRGRRARPRRRPRAVGSATRTASTSVPTVALSSAAVPSAAIRPWSTTAIRCASRSASSRYCVVSSTVVPSRRSSSTVLHSSCRVRGSRPVVGSSSRITGGPPGQAGAEVEPAAHAARVGRDRRSAASVEPEALEHLARARRASAPGSRYRRPTISRFSRPVSSSSTAANWPASPIRRRTASGSATTSWPSTLARPPVGLQQRGEDAHERRLAGAVGAEQAEHGAGLDLEVEAVERDDVAEGLPHALGEDRGRAGHGGLVKRGFGHHGSRCHRARSSWIWG